jgi:hypothetical protein
MVARLKLKGIDGRAPPGVNSQVLLRKATRNRLLVMAHYDTTLCCCDTTKLRESPKDCSTKHGSKETVWPG